MAYLLHRANLANQALPLAHQDNTTHMSEGYAQAWTLESCFYSTDRFDKTAPRSLLTSQIGVKDFRGVNI